MSRTSDFSLFVDKVFFKVHPDSPTYVTGSTGEWSQTNTGLLTSWLLPYKSIPNKQLNTHPHTPYSFAGMCWSQSQLSMGKCRAHPGHVAPFDTQSWYIKYYSCIHVTLHFTEEYRAANLRFYCQSSDHLILQSLPL